MAKLYVTEYAGHDAYSGQEPPITEQAFTFSSSTQSNAFAERTMLVRIHTDAICSIAFGADPTATTDSRRMVAGATEYFAVSRGLKVAAVANT
jgi:hypothetical protein